MDMRLTAASREDLHTCTHGVVWIQLQSFLKCLPGLERVFHAQECMTFANVAFNCREQSTHLTDIENYQSFLAMLTSRWRYSVKRFSNPPTPWSPCTPGLSDPSAGLSGPLQDSVTLQQGSVSPCNSLASLQDSLTTALAGLNDPTCDHSVHASTRLQFFQIPALA